MNRMEVKLKRGFFDRCHDYISSYLKDMTSTQSEDDESSSGDDHDDDDEDDVGGGNVVRPSFKMSGPYKKVSTKDRSASTFSDYRNSSSNWGGYAEEQQSHDQGFSKAGGSSNSDWSSNWNDADNQSWVSGGGQSDATSRAPKTSAARASGALKAKKEDPLIDFGVKEAKKDEWSSWENDAWESLSK